MNGNIICLTVCVLGLKKRGGSRGGGAPLAGGVGGGAEPPPICKLLTFIAPFYKGV